MDRARALLTAVTVAGCASPASRPSEFYFVSETVTKPVGRFVQATRPTACEGASQPAIVGFDGEGRIPVWSCLVACKPGNEYVTDALTLSRSTASPTPLNARCQPICAHGTRRLSYADFQGKAHCEPGDPPEAEARALEEEQARITRLHDRVVEEAVAPVEALMTTVEALPRPWSEESLEAFDGLQRAFNGVRKWHDDPRVKAVEARLDATYDVRQVASQARRDRLRAKRRADQCRASCSWTFDQCSQTCTRMPPAACDACRAENQHCEAQCP